MTALRSMKPARSGFSVVELLNSLALIIFIMGILSEAFSAGLAAFGRINSAGDLDESLRAEAQALTAAIAQSDAAVAEFIDTTSETGVVDHDEAGVLARQYEAIAASAADLEDRLNAVEQSTVSRPAQRALQWSINALDKIKISAVLMAEILHDLE